jgi:hypothetical protein
VHRLRSAAIPARFRGASRKNHERALLTARRDFLANPGSKFDFLTGSMWGPAKPQLDAETHGKCGYCEALARATAHCDVEHIRPKSVYWWLALCYDNYVLACQICNQTHKGDKYPVVAALAEPSITATATPAQIEGLLNTLAPDPLADDATLDFATYSTQLQSEDPDLVNPYHEDPEPLFIWVVDEVLAEVEIQPAAAGGRARDRAISTIAILGLNREVLKRLRFQTWRLINALCLALGAAGLPAAVQTQVQQSIQAAIGDAEAFAAMTRHLVRRIHGLPF